MQINGSSAAPSFGAGNPSFLPGTTVSTAMTNDVIGKMQNYASIVADGSNASIQEKVSAYVGYIQNQQPSSAWFTQSTQSERDAVNSSIQNSSFLKQAYALGDQFAAGSAAAVASSKNYNVDPSNMEYARFTKLSNIQQQLVYASNGSNFASLDEYVAFLKEQSDKATARDQTPVVNVSLSDAAKAALTSVTPLNNKAGNQLATTGPSEPIGKNAQAVKSVRGPTAAVSDSDVALSLLRNAANSESAAAAKASSKESNEQVTLGSATQQLPNLFKPYTSGSNVNAVA